MNLIATKPIAHRELFRIVDEKREPITNYTLEDLWNYYCISFIGSRYTASAADHITVAEYDRYQKSIKSAVPDMLIKDEQNLIRFCNKVGLEAVLYAIDIYSQGSYEIKDTDELSYKLHDGEVVIAEIERAKNIRW